MFDIIITNANIYDGTGKKPYCADIGIKDGKISEIGALKESFCTEVIDAKGLCVFPGFIDSHTHSDIALLNSPERKEALLQGITTEVISACGIGCVPLSDNKNEYIKTVKAIMGENEKGVYNDFKISWKTQGKSTFDVKAFKAEYPHINLVVYSPVFSLLNLSAAEYCVAVIENCRLPRRDCPLLVAKNNFRTLTVK